MKDPAGQIFLSLTLLAVILALIVQTFDSKEMRTQEVPLLLGLTGVVFAWTSFTPWTAILGLVFTIFGGLLSHEGSKLSSAKGDLSSRYLKEKMLGVLFVFSGLVSLNGGGQPLSFHIDGQVGLSEVPLHIQHFAQILLVMGALVSSLPFFAMGWAIQQKSSQLPARLVSTQLLPGIAFFALFFRLQESFGTSQAAPFLAGVCLFSSFLVLSAAIFQKSWQSSLSLITGGMQLIVFSIVLMGFPREAAGLEVSWVVSLVFLSLFGTRVLEGEMKKNNARIASFFLILFLATGGFLFVSGGVLHLVLNQLLQTPPLFVLLSISMVQLIAGFGATINWIQRSPETASERAGSDWMFWCTALTLVPLTLALFWQGAITGGIAEGIIQSGVSAGSSEHQILPGALRLFHTPQFQGLLNDSTALMAYVVSQALGWTLAVLLIRAKIPWSYRMEQLAPRFTRFVQQGYGMHWVAKIGSAYGQKTGAWIQNLIDEKVWGAALGTGVGRFSNRLSEGSTKIDQAFQRGVESLVSRSIEAPARLIQLVQNGDVQWYVFVIAVSAAAVFFQFYTK